MKEQSKKLVKQIYDELEKARILSVKEPMQLSDRVELNNQIRGTQQLVSGLMEWEDIT